MIHNVWKKHGVVPPNSFFVIHVNLFHFFLYLDKSYESWFFGSYTLKGIMMHNVNKSMCFDFDKNLINFMQFERTLMVDHVFLIQIFFPCCQDCFYKEYSESLKTYSSIFGTNGKGNKPCNIVSKYISKFIIKSVQLRTKSNVQNNWNLHYVFMTHDWNKILTKS